MIKVANWNFVTFSIPVAVANPGLGEADIWDVDANIIKESVLVNNRTTLVNRIPIRYTTSGIHHVNLAL